MVNSAPHLRVLVCGGRDFSDVELLDGTLDAIDSSRGPIKTIIHGNAPGADYWARTWAVEQGRLEAPFRADWHAHGKAAGPLRNQRMLDEGRPDLVVAFPGGRGTADMVRRAKAAGLEVIEVRHD